MFCQGNTCFLNSSLQALLHCPPVIAFFCDLSETVIQQQSSSSKPSRDDYKRRLVAAFGILLRAQWKGTRAFYAPKEIVQLVWSLNPFFRGYGQHDSQEFLRCFLDYLHEGQRIQCYYDYCAAQNTQKISETTEEEGKDQDDHDASTAAEDVKQPSLSSNSNGNGRKKKESKKTEKQSEKEEKEKPKAKVKPRPTSEVSLVDDIFQGRMVTSLSHTLSLLHTHSCSLSHL